MFSKKLIGALGAGIFACGMTASAAPADAAVHTVVNTLDAGNGSLRDAIVTANSTVAPDQIKFAIQGPGPHVISLANDLPFVTRPVSIQGYSEPNASPATPNSAANPSVVIDATNASRGLHLTGDNITVSGLVINDAQIDGVYMTGDNGRLAGNYIGTNAAGNAAVSNTEYGVHIHGDNHVVGGSGPAERNVISGNGFGGVHVHAGTGHVVEGNYLGLDENGSAGLGGGTGVFVESSQTTVKNNVASSALGGVQLNGDDNTVQGNKVGTDVTGTLDRGNFQGITVHGGDRNLIGGPGEGEGNLVSGNIFSGVQLTRNGADPAEDNEVQGNLIGTTASGNARIPNSTGVTINASNGNTIGGTADGAGNVISGNDADGVKITLDGADANTVQGNWIGTNESGSRVLGNRGSGVELFEAANNRIGATLAQNPANVIANNDGDGVTVTSGVGNSIVRNSIENNDGLGIDLGADGTTSNDGGNDDADSGANGLQNGPEIESASATAVEWELETEPNTAYRLEFYSNDTCDPSGSGEGQTLLDVIEVDTNANGEEDGSTTTAIPAGLGKHVSMTATKLVGVDKVARSTSEFSPCELTVE